MTRYDATAESLEKEVSLAEFLSFETQHHLQDGS